LKKGDVLIREKWRSIRRDWKNRRHRRSETTTFPGENNRDGLVTLKNGHSHGFGTEVDGNYYGIGKEWIIPNRLAIECVK
jgi:hypothetical protein